MRLFSPLRTLLASVVRRSQMTSSRVPLYRVQGTHYECARAIGVLTRDAIRRRIADDFAYLSSLFAFVRTDHGLQLQRDFLEAIRASYPWYWDELRGLADGSELPLDQLLVLNFLNETRTAFRLSREQETESETGEKGCTTVLINRKDTNTLALLHNEDHATALYMTGFLVEADIQSSKYEESQRESPKEKFIAYCYAGGIPGNAFGVNVHGFACTLNGLYPNFIAPGRLPRQIVNRALLSVRNEDDLDNLLNSSPVAYGFCVNGGFVFARPKRLLNYEIGPNLKLDNANYISKCWIVAKEEAQEYPLDLPTHTNYYVHYNHYERLDHLIVQQKALESTYSRWTRGQELGEIATVDDALNLLGDHANESFPIFRVPNQQDANSVTLCTVHIDFLALKLSIYQQNPKDNSQPALIYNLADLFHSVN